jgi:alpha-glucosidase
MKSFFASVIIILQVSTGIAQHTIFSPDTSIALTLTAGQTLALEAKVIGHEILQNSQIGLSIRDKPLDWTIRRSKTIQRNENIFPAVPEKRKVIRDHYNQLELEFKSGLSIQVRVYNDGFAYRFMSNYKDSITVESELSRYALPAETKFYGSAVKKRDDVDIFHTSFEEPYLIRSTDSIPEDVLFFSPVLINYPTSMKLVITESDIENYPGTFLKFADKKILSGVNAGFPMETKMNPGEFPQEVVTRRADFIARSIGKRTFPWRVFMVAKKDTELASNDMVYRLGSPSRISETDWIKPGKGTDEWIIGINLFNVPFKAGVNTETYKYYIDFAKRFGFERIMMDAGWSETTDLFKINPDINMNEISAYAKEKGISLSMWTLASTLDRQLKPALEQFKSWGVDFIMTDFMDRDDQKIVNFHHRIARACADKKIMVMFHGSFKPAGFSRTWPNAVTREGILGSEYNIWSDKATPDHDLLLPFIRMTAGPMDYEPGLLDNATKETFRPINQKVMSMGTRMHQAAMFVVYESPIQLFSGNPSQGLLEPEFMQLIGGIPTVWDETIVLDGRLGEYIVTARKRDDDFFVAGMTNWNGRTTTIDLSFLEAGQYDAVVAADGVNADRYPSDYIISNQIVDKKTNLLLTMAKGGGFLLILRKR